MKRNILSCIGLGVLGALAFTACAKEAPDELYIESTSNVFTALISPMVPAERRSSVS